MKQLKSFLLALTLSACIFCSACSNEPVNHNDFDGQNEQHQTVDIGSSQSDESQTEGTQPELEPKPEQNTETNTTPLQSSQQEKEPEQTVSTPSLNLSEIPDYSGKPYVKINNNIPFFTDAELTVKSFESYSSLDSLNRCGTAIACVGRDIMPTEERGSIGEVKPSGWHLSTYDKTIISDRYLFNRCHLIGYQLTGENANERNLITGTRYLNIEGMLPFENEIADYVERTGNHVMYRVTPVFEGNNLIASGVHMEAYSVEDSGTGVSFNVYCYNVQPKIEIDYATGDNWLAVVQSETPATSTETPTTQNTNTQAEQADEFTYVLNTNTGKFHYENCSSVKKMKESNKKIITSTRDEILAEGYDPCGNCNP